MEHPDLNLLIALDALLEEESVVGAARRMKLSAPAMSRTLGRIRQAFGDPILVLAGRRMVPTARALELRRSTHALVAQALALMQPEGEVALRGLTRNFVIRANDSFIVAFGDALCARLRRTAPGVTLRFAAEPADDDDALRDGSVDLFIGATQTLDPEVRVQALLKTAIVGAARASHPLFDQPMTPERFAGFDFMNVSRRGRSHGPIDTALAMQGLRRNVAMNVPSFATGLLALGESDLLLTIPDLYLRHLGAGLRGFPIPLDLPPVVVRQAWHPRLDHDPAHRWLRTTLRDLCAQSS